MKPHGGYKPPRFMAGQAGDGWSSPGVRGYRNLFGPAEPSETYRGYLGQDDGEERTRDLLHRVAQRMAKPYPWPATSDGVPGEDNRTIPSGYVYLMQLIAHDLSFLGSTFPSINDPLLHQQNLRTIALNLDTIYGGGPLDKPFAYRIPEKINHPRVMLRLGMIGADGNGHLRNPAHHERDLPRIGCPHLDGPEGRSITGLTDVLIADPRNDAQPMVAQTLVLFHMLHNAVCRRLIQDGGFSPADRELFAAARGVVTFLYARIIRHDLLGRLLNEQVYSFYEENGGDPLEKTGSTAMPVEFSHAAFRCGHVMLRPGYRFNEGNLFGLRDILQTNSSILPESMPLSRAWIINWSHFYELGDTAPNFSRRIAPYCLPLLFDQRMFGTKDGEVRGLPDRDLLRGASIHMRSVTSLIDKIPSRLREASPLLKDRNRWGDVVTKWLRNGSIGFSQEDEQVLTDDPPLLLFVLLEAAVVECGLRLGVLGSVIVAEVLYRALGNVPLRENDAQRAADVFGSNVPSTMPDLIRWLADAYALQDPDAGFIGPEQGLRAY